MPKRDLEREIDRRVNEYTWKKPVLMLVLGGLVGLVLFILGILINMR